MTAAAIGADVIVNGLNPPAYHNRARLIPKITAQVIAAAKTSAATVIIPGNVYNFGTARPGVWDESTPQTPTTRKGKIRVVMEGAYRAADIQTIILRAGNFIAPGSTQDVMGAVYLRDGARAAVAQAEQRHDLAWFEDVPPVRRSPFWT